MINAFEFEGKVENEFELHKVASYRYEEQDIIDNLDMQELPLYEYFQIEVENLSETIYHYGLDYLESGEDQESGAKRTILKTPHLWQNLDEYNEYYSPAKTENVVSIEPTVDFLRIIERGESNQVELKPCLLYNFKSGEGGIGVKYIIAKAICGFLNSNGGVIFIGISDDGSIQGLKYDYSLFPGGNEKDKFLLELDSLLTYFFDLSIKPLVNSSIENIDGKDILIISVEESYKPIFLRNKRSGQTQRRFI